MSSLTRFRGAVRHLTSERLPEILSSLANSRAVEAAGELGLLAAGGTLSAVSGRAAMEALLNAGQGAPVAIAGGLAVAVGSVTGAAAASHALIDRFEARRAAPVPSEQEGALGSPDRATRLAAVERAATSVARGRRPA